MPTPDARHIAAIGAVLASETRAAILCALIGGTAHTQIELGRAVGVSPSSVSEHIGILLDHGFVAIEAQGRHRYVRLASDEVAELVEQLSGGIGNRSSAPLPRLPSDLGFARSCYGHLAGALGVRVFDSFTANAWIDDDSADLLFTHEGSARLEALGVAVVRPRRCLDWSQRRPHLGGPTGVALLTRCVEIGWLQRHPSRPRQIQLTERGRRELPAALHLELP